MPITQTREGLLPVLPLRNTVIFPGLTQTLRVGRERSLTALNQAEKTGRWIVASQQRDKNDTHLKEVVVEPGDIHSVGTLCRIESIKGNAESGYQVVLRGINRMQLENFQLASEGYISAEGTTVEDQLDLTEPTRKALLDSIKTLAKEILKLVPGNTEPFAELVESIDDLAYLTYLCAGNVDIELTQKQKILETRNLQERSLLVLQLMQDLKEGLAIQAEIRGKMSQKFGQTQRNMILREQLKTIREELGEEDDSSVEEKMRAKIEDSGMPEEILKMAFQELKRLSEMSNQSAESQVIRNYLELLCALPWNKTSADLDIDLIAARKILDEDHDGLEKVKKRIIQHLAVMKLKKSKKGSILLLVGPPGVGKTSLGQSIARALSRKFVRVSLGGVRDDAEVRGHRRTYVGAMPGRIIQGIKRAEEKNPVFLLDELDKMSKAFSGDPGAAMLEVLDPEQNATFLDHYLDVPFDLSEVFFIATANNLESIPGPLLDRMEVIQLSGYTTAEKMFIAKNHLIPRQLREHGMTAEQLQIPDEILLRLISSYTREAGVRELQRKIAALVRGSSEKVLEDKSHLYKVSLADLEEVMGPEIYSHEVTESFNSAGVATGLAWTPVGGDILFIEATAMPGKGQMLVTGQLGDVMKESAQIAQSLIRVHQAQIESRFNLEKTDLHVHVPAGSIPKDGPSAGVTMLTALASLLSGRKINPRLAMTGEISLRGSVMPVGGIKEKIIAAHRAGVDTVILPKKNERDLKDIPEEIKSSLRFHFVENVSELLKIALDLDLKLDWVQESISILDTSLNATLDTADLGGEKSVHP